MFTVRGFVVQLRLKLISHILDERCRDTFCSKKLVQTVTDNCRETAHAGRKMRLNEKLRRCTLQSATTLAPKTHPVD